MQTLLTMAMTQTDQLVTRIDEAKDREILEQILRNQFLILLKLESATPVRSPVKKRKETLLKAI